MKVTYHVFKDYRLEGANESDETALLGLKGREKARAKRLLYSFVSLRYHPERGTLFVGATNRCGDILLEFHPSTGKFTSCDYGKSSLWDRYDMKIHKGLWLDEQENALYFGTASLARLHEIIDGPGGKLLRYDIDRKKFTHLGSPIPGEYIQGTVYDPRYKRMHIYTSRGCFASYDLRKKKRVRFYPMRSIPHTGCLDDQGAVWGTYAPHHAFFRYHPGRNTFEFPKGCSYPNARQAADIQFQGAGPTDSMINGGDGYLYTGNALGELYRINSKTCTIEYLGKPFPDLRLPGLDLGPDGWLYLCGGNSRMSMLGRYSREEKRFEHLGAVEHPDGTHLHYAHELVVVGNVVYIGETDNMSRSGYLWACEVSENTRS